MEHQVSRYQAGSNILREKHCFLHYRTHYYSQLQNYIFLQSQVQDKNEDQEENAHFVVKQLNSIVHHMT